MINQLHNAVVLTCHGNAYLQGFSIDDLMASDLTIGSAKLITFSESTHRFDLSRNAVQVAPTPNKWFEYLAQTETVSIQVDHKPHGRRKPIDYLGSSADSRNTVWPVQTCTAAGVYKNWIETSHTIEPEEGSNRNWVYEFFTEEAKAKFPEHSHEIEKLRSNLSEALQAIIPLSKKIDADTFTEIFQDALKILDGSYTETIHYRLSPPGFLSPDAESLLYASSKAWVIAGMGSWCDFFFDIPSLVNDFNVLTEQLYQALARAVIEVTNQTAAQTT